MLTEILLSQVSIGIATLALGIIYPMVQRERERFIPNNNDRETLAERKQEQKRQDELTRQFQNAKTNVG